LTLTEQALDLDQRMTRFRLGQNLMRACGVNTIAEITITCWQFEAASTLVKNHGSELRLIKSDSDGSILSLQCPSAGGARPRSDHHTGPAGHHREASASSTFEMHQRHTYCPFTSTRTHAVPTAAAPTAAPPTTARRVCRRATPATLTGVAGRPTLASAL